MRTTMTKEDLAGWIRQLLTEHGDCLDENGDTKDGCSVLVELRELLDRYDGKA
jgi:hypothetical protein